MERLWTKLFIQMTFAMLFLFTGFYLLVPTLPLFIKEIGGDESQVGLMMGMFTIAAVVIRPIIGGMLDQYGRRSFTIFGLIFFGLTMYSYNLATTIILLAIVVLTLSNGLMGVMIAAILYGIGFGSAQPALQAAMLTIVDSSKRGVANASFFTEFDLGIGLGAILLGVVSQMFGYRILFAGSAISGLIALIIFVVLVKQRLSKKEFA
ncbi:TPA: MFS transporter [Bacillus pacificus]|uniref:MFS transporter n=1 Tax=Bacillus pacificus TaxID=2026187 RepID=UPI000DCA46F4|nr:MFS transporter [Bacillus cereus]RAT04348.1 hypothetical protein A6E27_16465 [Bacillus cereus]